MGLWVIRYAVVMGNRKLPRYVLTKVCSRCGRRLPEWEFAPRGRDERGAEVGLQSRCKRCDAEHQREWRAEHPERVSEYSQRAYRRVMADPELRDAYRERKREAMRRARARAR